MKVLKTVNSKGHQLNDSRGIIKEDKTEIVEVFEHFYYTFYTQEILEP